MPGAERKEKWEATEGEKRVSGVGRALRATVEGRVSRERRAGMEERGEVEVGLVAIREVKLQRANT